MKRRSLLSIALLVALFMISGNAMAMNQFNASSLSMGGAQAPTARGVEVIGWNPAFLGFSDGPKVSMYSPLTQFANFGMVLANDFMSLDQIDKYFTDGQVWTDEDKQSILNEIDGDAWDIYTDFYLPIFAFSFPTEYVNVALSFDTGVSSNISFSKEFIDLALYGNGIDMLGQTRDFSDTDIGFQATSRFGLTFAKRFEHIVDIPYVDEITTGFTFTYNIGHAYGEVTESKGTFFTDVGELVGTGVFEVVNAGITGNTGHTNPDDDEDIEIDAMAGSGVGLDFGIGAKILKDKGVVGFSIINLINTMNWTGGQKRLYTFDFDQAPPLEGLDNFDTWVDSNLAMTDTLLSNNEDFTTELPTIIHLTGGYKPIDKLMVTAALKTQINDTPGMKKYTRLGFGARYDALGMLPVRAGFSVGGRGGFSYGMGFGLHFGFWHTDIGWAYERGFMNSANGIKMAFTTTWFFGGKAREL